MNQQTFEEYPLRLFGEYIPERGAGGIPDTSIGYFYLDVSYVRTLFLYGILMLLVYLAVMTLASRRSAKSGDWRLALALAVVAVVSVIEHHATEYSYNLFILAAFCRVESGKLRKSGADKDQTSDVIHGAAR